MNIEKWDIDRIMQLPDWCFGRKWPVSVGYKTAAIGTYYDLSELGLPDKCVIWQVNWSFSSIGVLSVVTSLALANEIPADTNEYNQKSQLLADMGISVELRRDVTISSYGGGKTIDIRMPLETAGKRLLGRFNWGQAITGMMMISMVISSIPKEVPDWVFSGRAGVLL